MRTHTTSHVTAGKATPEPEVRKSVESAEIVEIADAVETTLGEPARE